MVLKEIFLTTRCNLKCPMCLRTQHGTIIEDIDTYIIKSIPDIFEIYCFVSYNGEPTLHPKIFEIIKISKDKNKDIILVTNGCTHNSQWWYELGKLMNYGNSMIIVSIDGIKKSHEFYRIGSNWNSLIKNIQSFNKSGAKSICNTILFRHNENEIYEIKKIAKNIGCKKYRIKTSWYYDDIYKRPNINIKTREEVSLNKNNDLKCDHLNFKPNIKSYTLSIKGEYFPCCFVLQDIEYHNNNEDLIKLYHESKNDLIEYNKAINTPLFDYINNNIGKMNICLNKCNGVNCYDMYIYEHSFM